jgi:hypothetical protein
MNIPPKFPAQLRLEQVLEEFKQEQKAKEDKLREDFEDLREEQKIWLQRSALVISLLALCTSIVFGAWNARVSYQSLSTARRGFVSAHFGSLVKDGTQIAFEMRAVPPNPAIHIKLDVSCGTYVENGRKPEVVLTNLLNYENNLTLAPGDSRSYTCNTGSSEGMHAPHGIIQKTLLGVISYEDLAGNHYHTQFCFDEGDLFQMSQPETLVACSTHNDAN